MAELTPLGILRADQPAKTRKRDFHHRAVALADAIASSTWENAGPVHLRGEPFDESLVSTPKDFSRTAMKGVRLLERVERALATVGDAGITCIEMSLRMNIAVRRANNALNELRRRGRAERVGEARSDSIIWRAA